MFGLKNEQGDGDKMEETVFELEEQLSNPKKCNEMQKMLKQRISKLKSYLREGHSKGEFEGLGTLLHGYWSGLRIIARMKKKANGK